MQDKEPEAAASPEDEHMPDKEMVGGEHNPPHHMLYASATKRCKLCLTTSHTEKERTQGGDPDPEMRDRLKTLETVVLAIAKKGEGHEQPSSPAKPNPEPCRKYNSTGCTYPRCKYSHACSICMGNHPAARCSTREMSGYPARGGGSVVTRPRAEGQPSRP